MLMCEIAPSQALRTRNETLASHLALIQTCLALSSTHWSVFLDEKNGLTVARVKFAIRTLVDFWQETNPDEAK